MMFGSNTAHHIVSLNLLPLNFQDMDHRQNHDMHMKATCEQNGQEYYRIC